MNDFSEWYPTYEKNARATLRIIKPDRIAKKAPKEKKMLLKFPHFTIPNAAAVTYEYYFQEPTLMELRSINFIEETLKFKFCKKRLLEKARIQITHLETLVEYWTKAKPGDQVALPHIREGSSYKNYY